MHCRTALTCIARRSSSTLSTTAHHDTKQAGLAPADQFELNLRRQAIRKSNARMQAQLERVHGGQKARKPVFTEHATTWQTARRQVAHLLYDDRDYIEAARLALAAIIDTNYTLPTFQYSSTSKPDPSSIYVVVRRALYLLVNFIFERKPVNVETLPGTEEKRETMMSDLIWRDLKQHPNEGAVRMLALLYMCHDMALKRSYHLPFLLPASLYAAAAAALYINERTDERVPILALQDLAALTKAPFAAAVVLYGDREGEVGRALEKLKAKHPHVSEAVGLAELLSWWKCTVQDGSLQSRCYLWAHSGSNSGRLDGVWRAIANVEGYRLPIEWKEEASMSQPIFTPAVVAAFLGAYASAGKERQEQEVWRAMVERKLSPTPSIWHALVDGHLKRKKVDVERLCEVVTQMSVSRVVLSDKQRVNVVGVLMRHSKGQDEVAKTLLDKLVARSSDLPSVQEVASLLGVLLRADRESVALRLAELSVARFANPSLIVDALIAHHANLGKLEKLIEHAARLRALGAVPSVHGLVFALRTYLRAGKTDDALRLLRGLLAQGPPPRTLFEFLIVHCARLETVDAADNALLVLEEMQAQGHVVSIYMWTAVIQAYARATLKLVDSDTGEAEAAMRRAEEVLVKMRSKRVEPNRITYTELLRGHLALKTSTGTARALELFEEMSKSRTSLASLTTPWCVLLEGLEAAGEVRELKRRIAIVRGVQTSKGSPLRKLLRRLEGLYGEQKGA